MSYSCPFKLRAWDGRAMVLVQTICFNTGGALWYGPGNQFGWAWINPECTDWTKDNPKPNEDDVQPVMRWTGLRDKNGVDIWEGDFVLSSNDGSDGCGKWDAEDSSPCLVSMTSVNGVHMSTPDGWALTWDDEDSTGSLKYLAVVGNRYGNPDLLKT